MKAFGFSLLLCFLSTFGFGQALRGRILDSSGSGIPGCKVTLTGSNHYNTFSDSLGNFRIKNISPGRYNVVIFKEGYSEFITEGFLIENGNEALIEIELSENYEFKSPGIENVVERLRINHPNNQLFALDYS